MKLFLDTADIGEIRTAAGWGVLAGVTTNPTLIARAGREHEDAVREICSVVDGPVSAETVSTTRDELVEEGRRLAAWAPNVVVKVAMTPDGLSAGKILAGEGIRINVTLTFTVNQALLAASIGAYFVSPFVGRFDDIGEDGIQVVRDIVTAYRQQNIQTQVLAASLRHPMHVTQAALAGADVGTMPYKVMEAMFKHPLTDQGMERFLEDYRKAREEQRGRAAAGRVAQPVGASATSAPSAKEPQPVRR
jgi:transaldolase